ncbi:hypothetical protein RclHR1_05550014 [Rhizophagus clarus]|uniref:Crinkler effector protein N-terminal domain-containing protein n=1 Tax=Rhizophagus clarus TaxID=94130 RepID=A0A2Z6SFE3_9GLOM|nr:hypothetical protein RclHR1_05550014 [Rhizophagus clarus]GES93594.1 hypothetical protein GLOIN_2v1820807 [Rhizophagus clarus]
MSAIKLTCLIRENLPEDAFEIEIDKYESIQDLKKVISKKIPKEFTYSKYVDFEDIVTDPKNLILWKINISINEKLKFEQLKTHTLSIKKILDGEKMLDVKDIDHYFSNDMLLSKDFIHVVVELPIGIDKNLEKSWNALRNGKIINIQLSKEHPNYQFLCLPKDVSYLLGKDNVEQFLFIRNCYHHFADCIFKYDKCHLIGNPGIGKTYFSYYLLYQLAQQNKTVMYIGKDNEFKILFTKYYTLYNCTSYKMTDYDDDDVYYIIDNKLPESPYLYSKNINIILITSPWRRYYKYFEKDYYGYKLYLSVWSWEEIEICRHVNFYNISQEKVWELYNKWGGIPLFTLDYALNESKQKLLQRAIDIVDYNLLKYFGEMYFEKDISYMLAHILTNEKDEMILQFASEYVAEKFMTKLESFYKNELINSLRCPQYTEYSSLDKAIFEYIAHRTLLNGGSFDIKPLSNSMDNSKLIMPKREKLIFNDISDIKPDKYCIPSKKNFICDINAIVAPNIFFIMAVSEKYLNNLVDLDKLLEKFIDKSNESIIELYFVTPKYKETIVKNKNLPSLNDRLRKYILELDIGLIYGN